MKKTATKAASDAGKALNKLRNLKLSGARRKAISKLAVQTRWEKYRAKKLAEST